MMDYLKPIYDHTLRCSLLLLTTLFINFNAQASSRIAVIDFDHSYIKHQHLSQEIANLISNQLVNNSQFNVVERNRLKSIIGEINLSSSGLVSKNQLVQIGNLTGAEYLLTGKISNADVDTTTFSGYGVQTRKETYHLGVTIRILETETGSIVFSDNQETEFTLQDTHRQTSKNRIFTQLAQKLSAVLVDNISDSFQFKAAEAQSASSVVIQVQSTPSEADVEVDGVFYGNAGDSLSLPSGTHTVKISLPGYDSWEKKVLIREGLSIKARLRKSANLRIETIN